MSQAFSPRFSGPAAIRPRRELPRRWRRALPTIRLPRSARRELGVIAAAARRAEDGGAAQALGALEHTLLRRATFGPRALDRERIETLGYEAWLDEQLDFEALDDSELEETLHDALPSLGMPPGELYRLYYDRPFRPAVELWTATVFRAIYSPRQLYERLVTFWTDHFNIDVFAPEQGLLKPVDHIEVVRRHALSTFGDLLSASAHSPAMLLYLNNNTNGKNHPNENYARELLELHTMGADNGYTEEDVKEVARCFTGWTWIPQFSNLGEAGTFRFSSFTHDFDAKTVLKQSIREGGGIEDGEAVLSILAKRKETAEFIATKLLRYLWGYEPGAKDVNAVRRAFDKSGGDLRDTVRAALSPERMARATPKLKRPFHLVVSALRGLGAEIPGAGAVLGHLSAAGQLPFAWPPPDGYPDNETYWSGLVMPRFNFAGRIFDEGRDGSLTVDPAVDGPADTHEQLVDRLDELLLSGAMTASTRSAVLSYLVKGTQSQRRVRTAIGIAVSAPEFQEY